MKVAVLSDIHGNLEALEKVLRDAESWGAEEVWCLGDIVGYGPNPAECVRTVRRVASAVVMGNHDAAVVGEIPLDDFNSEARKAAIWSRDHLAPEDIRYLESLPKKLVKGDFTLVHGSPRHPIWEYVLSHSVACASFQHFDTEYCLVGHSHIPLVFQLQEDGTCAGGALSPGNELPLEGYRWILNPGSVGQPRDWDPKASYGRLDTERRLWEIVRISYPVEKTQSKMKEAGLPEKLIARLNFGW